MELAHLVWHRTLELTGTVEQLDQLAVVVELLRTAHHNASTMAGALAIGRTCVREQPRDLVARRGTRLLERATAFMGGEPRAGRR